VHTVLRAHIALPADAQEMVLNGDSRYDRGLQHGHNPVGGRDHSSGWIDRTNYSSGLELYNQVSNGHIILPRELTGHAFHGNKLSGRTPVVGFEALQGT
jgi:hypothetical protein